uniref:Uncharacterized protein n=1 Tax=viral metagenome TaxID=1070528 RepID=A0A6M3LQN5_9ZZZZ
MSDQCQYCTSKGDLNKCLRTECNYHNLWMVKEAKKNLMNEIVLQRIILESIEAILDGKEVSDFELSIPLVRRIADIKEYGWAGPVFVVGKGDGE